MFPNVICVSSPKTRTRSSAMLVPACAGVDVADVFTASVIAVGVDGAGKIAAGVIGHGSSRCWNGRGCG